MNPPLMEIVELDSRPNNNPLLLRGIAFAIEKSGQELKALFDAVATDRATAELERLQAWLGIQL